MDARVELGAGGGGGRQGGGGRGDEGEEELFFRSSRCRGGDGEAKEAQKSGCGGGV